MALNELHYHESHLKMSEHRRCTRVLLLDPVCVPTADCIILMYQLHWMRFPIDWASKQMLRHREVIELDGGGAGKIQIYQ